MFSHEKLDVYRAAIEYTIWSGLIGKRLSGIHRHAKDQLLRAALSIPSNIAEGHGRSTAADRKRFYELAYGATLQCAAIQDVLEAAGAIGSEENLEAKDLLGRITEMLTQVEQRGYLIEDAARYGKPPLPEEVPVPVSYEIME